MDWQKSSSSEDGTVVVPRSWLFTHYYDALNVLFRIENALRLFTYVVLKEQHGQKWRDLELQSEDQTKTTIAGLARRRIEQGKTFGYLTYPVQSPLMHLTSGELIGLITHDSYWPTFKGYFPASKHVATLKLQEIGTVRNALAHFRPVSENDVELVKQNANQMLARVEYALIEMLRCSQVVPTNEGDQWYAQLKTLGTEQLSLQFGQSKDETWIRVRLQYTSAMLGESSGSERFKRYRLTTLDASALAEANAVIKDHLLFVTESVRASADKSKAIAMKDVDLTFSRRRLQYHEEIKKALESILIKIAQESELLQEDQLARGQLVSVARVSARRFGEDGTFWKTDTSSLLSPEPTGELPEYWGRTSSISDFVSDTDEYPWMPVAISDIDASSTLSDPYLYGSEFVDPLQVVRVLSKQESGETLLLDHRRRCVPEV